MCPPLVGIGLNMSEFFFVQDGRSTGAGHWALIQYN